MSPASVADNPSPLLGGENGCWLLFSGDRRAAGTPGDTPKLDAALASAGNWASPHVDRG